jgi:hypothetical protein
MGWVDVLKQRPFTAEELEFHGGQRNAEQARRAQEAVLAEKYRTEVQGQQVMPGYGEDEETTFTATPPRAKDRERARNLKFTSRDAYRQYLDDTKDTRGEQAQT